MKLPVILLFLQLWANMEVCSSQNVCSRLPRVPHAFVSSDTTKSQYQQGDVIHFTCERGYTSSQISKYVCTSEGWLAVRQGTCYSCSTLPVVPHAQVSEETKKAEYREGDMIHFTCEPDYTSGQTSRYVCTKQGWLAVGQGSCYIAASSCNPPPADGGITIQGLPENNDPIVPDQIITFSCDGPGKNLSGSSVLICGEDGQWNKPFPSCKDITCKLGVMHRQLFVAGLPPAAETMTVGHKLRFQCNNQYSLEGSEEIECLATGQWNAPFPTCADTCKVPRLTPGIRITNHRQPQELRVGQSLQLACSSRWLFIQGNETITCSAGGRWSDSFPTCGDPADCGKPSGIENGDAKYTVQSQYSHGERVEYVCQNLYTMQGGPYKTCFNGKWTGQMRCLKPCVVDQDVKRTHNIDFRYSAGGKMYAAHNEHITFTCIRGTTHDGRREMRQRCDDGVMLLPTCQ